VQRAGSEIDKITKVARRESARAAVLAAKAELEQARLDLEFCEVRAPLDGRITKNLVDVGNLVGTPGLPTLLATLVCSRPVYVTVDVSESDLLSVAAPADGQGQSISSPPDRAGRMAAGRPRDRRRHRLRDPWPCRLRRPGVETRRPARSACACRFDNEDEFLLPGLFVRVRFPMATEPAILAPDIALAVGPGGTLRTGRRRARRRPGAARQDRRARGTLRIVSEGSRRRNASSSTGSSARGQGPRCTPRCRQVPCNRRRHRCVDPARQVIAHHP